MRYKIEKPVNSKRDERYVIISQVSNFMHRSINISKKYFYGSKHITFPVWEEYFMKDVGYPEKARGGKLLDMPFHYFMEQVSNDFVINVAAPEYMPSSFINKLIDVKLLPPMYRNSIVVAVGEYMVDDVLEKRGYDMLAHRLLVPLIRNNRYLSDKNIVYIDDIVDLAEAYIHFKNKSIPFEIERSLYYDGVDLKNSINHFNTQKAGAV